jgi:hypothetical protein
MADKVDGGGTCQNAPENPDDSKSRHEWRFSYMYQVPQPQSAIVGAPPVPNETRHMYYCVYCLEERSAPTNVPVVPGLSMNIVVAGGATPSAPPLLN